MITHGKPQAIGSALARLANVARESGVELHLAADESEKHGLEPAAVETRSRHRRRPRRRRDDAARARAVPRHRRARDRRQLRPRRLSRLDRARPSSRAGSRACSPASTVIEDVPTLDVEVGDERRVAVNDLVVASAVVGRMVQLEWAVGGEGLGRLGVRRARLRDSLRLDGLQLLERRAGARLGARRDGGHLRRAALAERPPARRPARRRADRLEPDGGRGRDRARRRPPVGDLPRAAARSHASASSARCSRPCPR